MQLNKNEDNINYMEDIYCLPTLTNREISDMIYWLKLSFQDIMNIPKTDRENLYLTMMKCLKKNNEEYLKNGKQLF
jgi:hypothetical protein